MKNFNLNIEFQGGANYNEEKIQIDFFNKAISNIKDSKPSMIEIGSNDCFYSILFNKSFDSNCINICAEVSENLLQLGMKNVKNNNCSNFYFKYARVGNLFDEKSIENDKKLYGNLSNERLKLIDVLNEFNLQKISIIHMDVQGSELEILEEILLDNIKFDYIFISTHNSIATINIHEKCLSLIEKMNSKILFENPTRGGLGDGLIVAKN